MSRDFEEHELRARIAAAPNDADALHRLAVHLCSMQRFTEALEFMKRLVALAPHNAQMHNNLGGVFAILGQPDQAMTSFRRAVELDPKFPPAHFNIGNLFRNAGELSAAAAAYQNALAADPSYLQARVNLGSALRDLARADAAHVIYQQGLKIGPQNQILQSCLLYNLWFIPGLSYDQILAAHQEWERTLSAPPPAHFQTRDHARLRIAYLSPNFRQHVVGIFIEPILAHHDRSRFEITCYSDVIASDTLTHRLSHHVEHWKQTAALSDQQLIELIRNDEIDILVDLTLHMAHNRIPVFVAKPAPVQMTYLGYAGTTGLSSIDYRLTDPFLDPQDLPAGPEKLLCLPAYWSYVPPDPAEAVGESPCTRNGFVTFASLNTTPKLNRQVIELWTRILTDVPTSHLLLFLPAKPTSFHHLFEPFQQLGIAPTRIHFVPPAPRARFIQNYHRADIALDSFPCAGGVTTLDAIWSGVPVVTLTGQTPVARAGQCILNHIDAPELIANSEDEYVSIATTLARDPARLADYRASLRSRLQQSKLMNPIALTTAIERRYLDAWPTAQS